MGLFIARRSLLIAIAIQPESLELVVTRLLVRGFTRMIDLAVKLMFCFRVHFILY